MPEFDSSLAAGGLRNLFLVSALGSVARGLSRAAALAQPAPAFAGARASAELAVKSGDRLAGMQRAATRDMRCSIRCRLCKFSAGGCGA